MGLNGTLISSTALERDASSQPSTVSTCNHHKNKCAAAPDQQCATKTAAAACARLTSTPFSSVMFTSTPHKAICLLKAVDVTRLTYLRNQCHAASAVRSNATAEHADGKMDDETFVISSRLL
jgi:hypothetical protein